MTTTDTPARPLGPAFESFAQFECFDDPLYVALTRLVAQSPARGDFLLAAPSTQARPVLWLAAIHDRLLERAAAGDAPALARYYASLGGMRAPDDALAAALDGFLQAEAGALRALAAARGTQTNECARGAVLLPVLGGLAQEAGGRPLALLDVGCSAGLNLLADRYAYRWTDASTGDTLAAWTPPAEAALDDGLPPPPVIASRLAGPAPRLPQRLDIASRTGIDLAPVDADDERELRWLRACLWPSDTARRARFDAAVARVRRARPALRRVDDATEAVADWIAAQPREVLPVVVNTWVLAYFGEAALRRHVLALAAHAARGEAAWVSGEMARCVRDGWPALPAPTPAETARAVAAGVDARELGEATMWTVATAGASPADGPRWRLAARSHGHGRWVQFAGPAFARDEAPA